MARMIGEAAMLVAPFVLAGLILVVCDWRCV